MKGGKRKGAGRPKAKELKVVYSLRAYPSLVLKLRKPLQKVLDSAVRDEIEMQEKEDGKE